MLVIQENQKTDLYYSRMIFVYEQTCMPFGNKEAIKSTIRVFQFSQNTNSMEIVLEKNIMAQEHGSTG